MFAQLTALLMLMQQMPAPGASGALMVTYQGQTYRQEFGLANDRTQTAITSKTRFVIGSTSKQYTTTAIMKLEEAKLLKTSDPITKVLPELSFKTVTIEQLMNHTSGIPDAYNEPLLQNKLYQKPITLDDFFKVLKKAKLDAQPGTTFTYSNTNYVLLGEIIRRLSKMSFDEYMKKAFFEPFKLNSTTAGLSLLTLEKNPLKKCSPQLQTHQITAMLGLLKKTVINVSTMNTEVNGLAIKAIFVITQNETSRSPGSATNGKMPAASRFL